MTTASPPSLRVRAMRFLARREHSREELRRKLLAHAAAGDELDAVLDDLVRRGWLSDARFAEQVIRAKGRRYGPAALAHVLRGRGLGEEAIAEAFRAAGPDGASCLESVWKRQFRLPPGDERERARQVRFLQGRGFALEEVLRFIRSLEERR